MKIALDIDDTITALPELFAEITRSGSVRKVLVISSRTNLPEVRESTLRELAAYGIQLDELILIESYERAQAKCPHGELDWHQKYLWQKVDICIQQDIDIVFEDDPKVLALFERFAPGIQRVQIHRK